MKLSTVDRTIKRSGNFPESQFKIAATAKAFEILSSRLYTDPRLAIVRELSTNARDAHVEAGNAQKPFDVHLPNHFQPYFSIRDYGTGLSPESVQEVYTTYFASTRNDSNDYTGALGLGSKSPFSYTDQFTVVSYYNGKAYTYSAFKSETGEPSIAGLSCQDTTEPNGLEIKINIANGDERDFIEAARKVYRFFSVKPNVTGFKLEWPDVLPTFTGPGYRAYGSEASYLNQINVIMGEVCYAVDSDSIKHELEYEARLVIEVDIGDCEFAASREELHYDDKTVELINTRIAAAITDMRKQIDQALQCYSSLLDKFRASKQYARIINCPIISSKLLIRSDKQYTMKRAQLINDKIFIRDDTWQNELTPSHDTKYIFIENDVGELKQKHKSAIRYYMQGLRGNGAYYYLAVIQDPVAFANNFGLPDSKVSALPEAPKATRGSGTANRSYVKRYSGDSRLCFSWETSSINPDPKKAIAVPRKPDGRVVLNGQVMDPYRANDIASLFDVELWGITEAYYDRICDELEMESLETLAENEADKIARSLNKYQIARLHNQFSVYDFPMDILKKIKDCSDTCKDMFELASENALDHRKIKLMEIFKTTPKPGENFADAFKTRYPLMASINLQYVKIKDLIEYINLKENT